MQVDKHLITVEHHCLEMRYRHLRLQNPTAIEKLTASIEQYGQLVPVVIIPQAENQWILIDGYHRVKALKRLGKDIIAAEVWDCDTTEALLMILKNHSARALEIFEEALLLHELHNQAGLSQSALSERVGRDKSWVSRRLSLLEFLPENILQAISQGKISLWISTRVLAPLARANTTQSDQILNYIIKKSHKTSEIHFFYEHYQKSNRQERTKMVDNPELFFKAHRAFNSEKQARVLKNGPEGEWRLHCCTVVKLLSELNQLAPTIFYRQKQEACSQFLQELNQAESKFNEVTNTVRRLTNANQGITPNHSLPPAEWKKQ
jgi:ParB/RepB/Spo0J family partition protein